MIPLGLGHALTILGERRAGDAEQLRLERGPVVEGEDVEGAVVSGAHGGPCLRWGVRGAGARGDAVAEPSAASADEARAAGPSASMARAPAACAHRAVAGRTVRPRAGRGRGWSGWTRKPARAREVLADVHRVADRLGHHRDRGAGGRALPQAQLRRRRGRSRARGRARGRCRRQGPPRRRGSRWARRGSARRKARPGSERPVIRSWSMVVHREADRRAHPDRRLGPATSRSMVAGTNATGTTRPAPAHRARSRYRRSPAGRSSPSVGERAPARVQPFGGPAAPPNGSCRGPGSGACARASARAIGSACCSASPRRTTADPRGPRRRVPSAYSHTPATTAFMPGRVAAAGEDPTRRFDRFRGVSMPIVLSAIGPTVKGRNGNDRWKGRR